MKVGEEMARILGYPRVTKTMKKRDFFKRTEKMGIDLGGKIPNRKMDEVQTSMLEVTGKTRKIRRKVDNAPVVDYTTQTQFMVEDFSKALALARDMGANFIRLYARHDAPLMLEWKGYIGNMEQHEEVYCRFWLAPKKSEKGEVTEAELFNKVVLGKL